MEEEISIKDRSAAADEEKRIGARVANEILMMFRAGKKYARDVSLYDPVGVDKDGETVNLIDILETGEREALDTIILDQDVAKLYEAYHSCLKETEQLVLRKRYGLFGEEEHTQREIAGGLGISRSYVSRIEKKALEKLKAEFERESN